MFGDSCNFHDDFQNDEEVNIPELVEKLHAYNVAYYNEDESPLSDEEYDRLKDLLKSVSPNHPFLSRIGSPISKVSEWKKAHHKIAMGSLNKVNTKAEFKNWAKQCDANEFMLSVKLDGISIDLEYEKGKLIKAITRGDGIIGEDILSNVLKMQNVKKEFRDLALVQFTGSLRGEIVIHRDDFIALNKESEKNGDRVYKNPRNSASGIAKNFDGKYAKYCSILYYDIVSKDKEFKTELEKFQSMDLDLNLEMAPNLFCENIECCLEEYENYEESLREEWPYELDGLVIVVNDIQKQKDLGETYGNKKGAIAWKFGAVYKNAVVKNVRWDMGKNGTLTPVCEIDSVRLMGTDIKNVNIYNLDYFKKYKLGIGDIVKIFRANDVIPKIESIVEHVGKKFKILSNCPTCNNETEELEKFLVCSNEECESKYLGNLNKFVEVLQIMNISEGIIEKLYNAKVLKHPQDFFKMKLNHFSDIEGLGEKSFNKIMEHFLEKTDIELPVFIGALNILQISTKIAEKIYNAGYDTIDKMEQLNEKQLVQIKGLKEKTAYKFINGLKKKKSIIQGLLDVGITIKKNERKVVEMEDNKLEGKSFCWTGSLEKVNPDTNKNFKREEAWDLARKYGGIVSESVKKGLDYLVTPNLETNSSKAQKARKYGVQVISENEFWKMLNL
jgi:DNA ligase (NAD+)